MAELTWDDFPEVQDAGNSTPADEWSQFPEADPPHDSELLGHFLNQSRSGWLAAPMALGRQMVGEKIDEARQLPIVGGLVSAAESAMVFRAANRIKDNKAKAADFPLVTNYLLRNEEKANGPMHRKVFDVIGQMPGFMGEMVLTGGAFTAARKAAVAGIEKAIPAAVGKIATKAAGNVAGIAGMAAANPQHIASGLAERMTPPIQPEVNQAGDVTNVAIGEGDSFLEAMPKAYLDTMIELGSERAGGHIVGALAKIPGAARIEAIKNLVVGNWLAKPGRTTQMLDAALKAGGWNGVIGEMLEERAGDVARLATGLESPDQNVTGQLGTAGVQAANGNLAAAKESASQALQQLAVEGLAFSVPGAVAIAARGLDRPEPQTAANDPILQKKLDDEVSAYQERQSVRRFGQDKAARDAAINQQTNASRHAPLTEQDQSDLLPPGEFNSRRAQSAQNEMARVGAEESTREYQDQQQDQENAQAGERQQNEQTAEELAKQERDLYVSFYSSPESAAAYVQKFPEQAAKIAAIRSLKAPNFTPIDPDLPQIDDAPVLRKWKSWVSQFVADPSTADAHIQAHQQAQLPQGQRDPRAWQRLPDGVQPPANPAVEVKRVGDATFFRFNPGQVGNSPVAQSSDTVSQTASPGAEPLISSPNQPLIEGSLSKTALPPGKTAAEPAKKRLFQKNPPVEQPSASGDVAVPPVQIVQPRPPAEEALAKEQEKRLEVPEQKANVHEGVVGKIGENAKGQKLFQDDRGVRYRIEDGIRITEPVELVPVRMENGGIRYESKTDRTKPEWQTTEESHPEQSSPPSSTLTNISRDQALAIMGGRPKLLPKPGTSTKQLQDPTGRFVIGQTKDGQFFTTQMDAPSVQALPGATKKLGKTDPADPLAFSGISPAHAKFQAELLKLREAGVLDKDDATIIRAIFQESDIQRFASTKMSAVDAMRENGRTVEGAAARVRRLYDAKTKQLVGHELEAAKTMPAGAPDSVSVILHELGHIAWSHLPQEQKSTFSAELFKDGSDIRDVMEARHGANLAGHFASNPEEAFAQLFADTMLERRTAGQDSSAVASWIRKILDIIQRILTGVNAKLSPDLQAKLDPILDAAIGYEPPKKRLFQKTPPKVDFSQASEAEIEAALLKEAMGEQPKAEEETADGPAEPIGPQVNRRYKVERAGKRYRIVSAGDFTERSFDSEGEALAESERLNNESLDKYSWREWDEMLHKGMTGFAGEAREQPAEKPVKRLFQKKPTIKERAQTARDEYHAALDEAAQVFREAGLGMNQPLNPKVMSAVVKVAAKGLKAGVLTFADFVNDLSKVVGRDKIPALRDYLSKAWDAARVIDQSGKVEAADYEKFFKEYDDGERSETRDEAGPEPAGVDDTQDLADQQTPSSGTHGAGGDAVRGGTRGGAGSGGGTRPDVSAGNTTAAGDGDIPPKLAESGRRGVNAPGQNYRITAADQVGAGGKKDKYRQNIAAIKLLKQLEAEGRKATPEEQAILVKYAGWGGLKEALSTKGENHRGWEKENAETRSLLTPEEWSAAASSTQNAHYTSPDVIRAMWAGLAKLGFKGGRVVEPGMGVGHFFGLMPDNLASASTLTGVEKDSITGRIAQQLYQQADIHVSPFERVSMPDGRYDLFISNVPFANVTISDNIDRDLGKLRANLHDYFFAKALKKVRPGGLVAFITSHGTMDKVDSGTRQRLAEQADLLGAIRLPNTAFKGNAHTEVTTDILVLQKRPEGQSAAGESFVKSPVKKVGNTEFTVNEYFNEHPDHILGTLSDTGTMRHGNELTVEPDSSINVPERISEIIGDLKPTADIDTVSQNTAEQAKPVKPKQAMKKLGRRGVPGSLKSMDVNKLDTSEDTPEGSLFIRDGKLFRSSRGSEAEEEIPYANNRENSLQRIYGLSLIRNAALDLTRNLQIDPEASDKQIDEARKHLNALYDQYVREFGYLNSPRNVAMLGADDNQASVLALEIWDSDEGTGAKADIFSKRTQYPHKPITKANSPDAALAATLSERGRVDPDFIGELLNQDPEAAMKSLGDLAYRDPVAGWVDASTYLSGNVRQKLKTAQAAAKQDKAYARNVEALEKVQPEDIPHHQITAAVGASWIPGEVYGAFAEHISGRGANYHFVAATGQWAADVDRGGRGTEKETIDFGTNRRPSLDLLLRDMNHQSVDVYDTVGDDRVLNTDETAAAKDKLGKIREEFQTWLWQDKDRATNLANRYNELLNATVKPRFDGSHLTLPGKSATIELTPWQKDGVWRILTNGNTLLDWVVGAGKTWAMVGAAMEARRIGLAKKPMVVVPNHLIQQWQAEFLQLYPGAKVLAASPADFAAKRRKVLMQKITTGDWDAVIVPASSFERLPIHPEKMQDFFRKQINELEEEIHSAKRDKGKDNKNYVAELEAAKDSLKQKMDELAADWKKDAGPYFDQLGVDMLLVDEAHEYKNLWFRTRMYRVPGISPQFVQKTFDLLVKTDHLNQTTGGRGVVFATGTPVSNSISEMFTMQRYLQPGSLKAANMGAFDAWAHNFGQVVTDVEVTPEGGGFRMHSRFREYVNLPELQQMYAQIADTKLADDIKLPRPHIQGGKPQTVEAKPPPGFDKFIESLVHRAEHVRSGIVDPRVDNMLNITTDGRKAATDMRLLDPSAPDLPDSKINEAVRNVYDIWKEKESEKATQIVWLDMGVPQAKKSDTVSQTTPDQTGDTDDALKAGRFDLYADIKKKLIDKGVPAEEVAFIHDAKTPEQRANLFKKMRSGRVRILIANSKRMATGANVQARLYAAHHIDAPWKPAEVEQRDGRIVRRGNRYEKEGVRILRYVTKGSFDAYMWQTLEQKAKGINALRTDTGGSRNMEAVDSQALEYAEIKALASRDPRIMEYTKLRAELAQLEALSRAHQQAVRDREWRLKDYKNREADLREKIPRWEKAVAELKQFKDTWERVPGNDKRSPLTVDGKQFDTRTDAGDAFLANVKEREKGGATGWMNDIGQIAGWQIDVQAYKKRQWGHSEPAFISKGKGVLLEFEINRENSAGTLSRIENALDRAPARLVELKEELDNADVRIQELQKRSGEAFTKKSRLDEVRTRVTQLETELRTPPTQTAAPPPSDPTPSSDTVSQTPPDDIRDTARDDDDKEIEGYGFKPKKVKQPPPPKHPLTPQAVHDSIYGDGFIGNDVVPTLHEAAATVTEAAAQIQATFAPQTRGGEARTMKFLAREHGAVLQRRRDIATKAFAKASKFFAGRTEQENYDFIDRMENGQPQVSPELDQIASQLRKLLDDRRDEVRALGTGKLAHFIQDYFPHIWQQPDKAAQALAGIVGKRPLEGPKSFLKKRSIDTFSEGIQAGLTPITDNPVDLSLLKIFEVDRYILGQRLLADMKSRGLTVFVPVNQKPAEGLSKIDDKIATVYGAPTIPIAEHVDKSMWDALNAVAAKMGVKHVRKHSTGMRGALGYSVQGGNEVVTRANTDLSVLAHEISHQLDHKYDLQKKFLSGQTAAFQAQLRTLADLHEYKKRYFRKRSEKMATLLEAYVRLGEQGMRNVAPDVTKEFLNFAKKTPELKPLLEMKPTLANEKIVTEHPHGGLLIHGHWHAPDPAANVINNYLSPGLRSRSGVFRAYLGLANVMNQFQLGLSAFHLGFTSMDAATSKLALAVEQARSGKPIEAAKSAALGITGAAAITNALHGDKLLKEWLEPGSQGAEIAKLVDGLVKAGGRVQMDDFYRTHMAEQAAQAFKEGNVLGGILRLPFALTDVASKPIMEWIVPRQKLGVFADLAEEAFEKLGPNANDDDVREAMAKAWDSADNRMGQVVYDNLFWNKAAKEVAMASVRSLGWNLGTFRELGGGAVDWAKAGWDVAHGKKAELSHRMAYTIAMPALAAMIGGILHYLMTGEPPEETKDWFYPKTGKQDEYGHDIRLSLPSYMKDVYAYSNHPTTTLGHKLHPAITSSIEMLQNKDFYGTKIRNEDDPLVQQALDAAGYAAQQFIPFAIRGQQQIQRGEGGLAHSLLPFIGVTPSPSSITHSSAEQLASELLRQKLPIGARTREKAQEAQFKAQAARHLAGKKTTTEQIIKDAEAQGVAINADDMKAISKRSKMTPLQHAIEHLDARESMKVWYQATEEERKQISDRVASKIANSRSLSDAEMAHLASEVGPAGQKALEEHYIRQAATLARQVISHIPITTTASERAKGLTLKEKREQWKADQEEAKQLLGKSPADKEAVIRRLETTDQKLDLRRQMNWWKKITKTPSAPLTNTKTAVP